MTRITPVGPAAAELLAAIHAQAVVPPWDAAAIGALMDSPGVLGLVSGEPSAPTGLVMVRTVADEAEILTLAVLPPSRRGGVGAALMRAALDGAAAMGARRVFLEVAEDNHPAAGLYARLGFAEVGRRRDYYRAAGGAAVSARVLSLDLAR